VAEWSCSGLQSRLRRFDSDPSLQLPLGMSLKFLAFVTEQAVARRLVESLNCSRKASFDLGWVTETTRLRPTSRFREEMRRDATRLHQPLSGDAVAFLSSLP
jgi:hypothetical protein